MMFISALFFVFQLEDGLFLCVAVTYIGCIGYCVTEGWLAPRQISGALAQRCRVFVYSSLFGFCSQKSI